MLHGWEGLHVWELSMVPVTWEASRARWIPAPWDTWRVAIARAGRTRGGSAWCTQGVPWPCGMHWVSVLHEVLQQVRIEQGCGSSSWLGRVAPADSAAAGGIRAVTAAWTWVAALAVT